MLKKAIFLLFIFFIFQTITSCICDCKDYNDVKIIYTGLTVSAYNTSGFTPIVVEDSVNRNTFGLEVQMDIVQDDISDATFFHLTGFSSIYALSCDCVGPSVVYEDEIENVEIYIDKDGKQTLATNAFSIQDYNGEWISLGEFFQIREEWHDGFQIQLKDFDAVPEVTKFLVKVILTSGEKFSATTQEIIFI